jgi:hypothetical protein
VSAAELVAEYQRLGVELGQLHKKLIDQWATLSVQEAPEIDRRLHEIEQRRATIRGLKSVAGSIAGS